MFDVIERYFQVFNNDSYNDIYSQDHKISKLEGPFRYLNKKFFQIYEPLSELAVDENFCL